ncbi:MAG: nucleotidyltransferase family protein [Pseudomonadota bacterium]
MFRSDVNGLTLKPGASMRDALQSLENSAAKIALTVDNNGKLTGIVTDGDVRRALLAGVDLNAPALKAANTAPHVVDMDEPVGEIRRAMQESGLLHVPVVDEDGRPSHLWMRVATRGRSALDVPVVLMAGGEGRRLRPLTENTPKPLLNIGERPILEHILNRFRSAGFSNFFISINYLGHMIEEYFGDGSQFGVSIQYLRENEKLGTAGALSLLPNRAIDHVIVMNGDLLTDVDFNEILGTHVASRAGATMCVREHRTQVPFGVVNIDGSAFGGIVEKPTMTHFVNAGVYCLSREALNLVQPNTFFDMPELFEKLRGRGDPCAVHPISGSRWMDIGTPEQLTRARAMFENGTDEGLLRS